MMFRTNSQHFCVALRALFVLAGHTAIVGHNRLAFWADALAAASHSVLAILFGHLISPERVLGMRRLLMSTSDAMLNKGHSNSVAIIEPAQVEIADFKS